MNKIFIHDKKTIEIAFKKLQANIYFDKNDLFNRAKIAEIRMSHESSFDEFFQSISNKIIAGVTSFQDYFDKIELRIIPKSIDPDEDGILIPKNFYTNEHLINKSQVTKLSIFIDLPIELQIISVLWLMKYGSAIDHSLKDHNYGNRLFINENMELGEGRTLFKPYQEQYQRWWSKAVDKTKDLLDSKEDSTILSFDLKNFFHTIRFDFEKLENFIVNLKEKNSYYEVKNIKSDPIHLILKEIHKVYKLKINQIHLEAAFSEDEKLTPLPIGLLTSHVLANLHLTDFDKQVIEELNPVYYGRYVDDILIVLKDRILHLSDIKEENNKENQPNDYITHLFFKKYLNKVFKLDSILLEYKLNTDEKLLSEYSNLALQSSKIFIYQFNHKMSPNLLSKFVKEQEKRSYIFQFLSDESDDMFNEFEIDAFEDSLDENDVNKSKFRSQEINKFRFSVFMAKLIKRRMLNNGDYKNGEIEKISKYFKGIYCIKNYHFWEKLFTLYVIAEDHHKFFNLLESILTAIDGLKYDQKSNEIKTALNAKIEIIKDIESQISKNLKTHLENSLKMALGLNPSFLNKKEDTKLNFINENHKKYLEEIILNRRKLDNPQDYMELSNEILFFRKTSLLRHSYTFYPLVQFIDFVKNGNFPLFKNGVFDHFEKDISGKFEISNKHLIPYRIKFYEATLFTIYKELYTKSEYKCTNCKRWHQNEILVSSNYLMEAFALFKSINDVGKSSVLLEYFKSTQETNDDLNKTSFDIPCHDLYTKTRTKNFLIHQLFIKNGGKSKDKLRIAMINKYVPLSDYEASLEGNPIITEKRVQTYLSIIDQVKKVPDCDIFVMPELSLPHDLLPTFISKSAHNQVAFIAGIEHWKISNIGFNFVFTNLPIEIDGDKDAIPVIRLKNHYAPIEEDWINGKYMIVPKPFPYRYDLFIWRGVYFSTYYCYELADVFHRYALNGKIDIMFAPVWNSDTNYYNNIAEVTTRDMHINLVQVNTSQYGESRVIRPTDSQRKDKARIKGGTVPNYNITISVSDIELKDFRDFQTKNFNTQKLLKIYKPTPPDFPIEDVIIRIKNKEFTW